MRLPRDNISLISEKNLFYILRNQRLRDVNEVYHDGGRKTKGRGDPKEVKEGLHSEKKIT